MLKCVYIACFQGEISGKLTWKLPSEASLTRYAEANFPAWFAHVASEAPEQSGHRWHHRLRKVGDLWTDREIWLAAFKVFFLRLPLRKPKETTHRPFKKPASWDGSQPAFPSMPPEMLWPCQAIFKPSRIPFVQRHAFMLRSSLLLALSSDGRMAPGKLLNEGAFHLLHPSCV